MPDYTLEIQFDDQGLQTIYAASLRVTIVKSVGGGTPVSWVSFHPMERNTVEWEETYSVYASTTAIEDGAQIFTQSTRTATAGDTYTFRGGRFASSVHDLPPTMYGVRDGDPSYEIGGIRMITSGLYQGAVVNGQNTSSPLNAVALPYNNTAVFTPVEKLLVFTSHHESNGLVVSQVSSPALLVDLTHQSEQVISFSDATNQFALGPLASTA